MSTTLHEFVSKALVANRIRFGDLRRLKRDILPYRITTPDEAEILLALDAAVQRADRDWREYLVPAVAQFVVWGFEPTGRIDQEKAEWLLHALASARPKIASAVIRSVMIDAPCIDETVILRPKPARDGQALGVPSKALTQQSFCNQTSMS
jgi:hypothetical protein